MTVHDLPWPSVTLSQGCFRVDTKGDAAVEAALRKSIAADMPAGVTWAMNLGEGLMGSNASPKLPTRVAQTFHDLP